MLPKGADELGYHCANVDLRLLLLRHFVNGLKLHGLNFLGSVD